MSNYQSLVENKLHPVGTSNKDIIYRCPRCEGDTGSGHLYINYDKGYFHCFKCSFKGRRIESLLKYLNVDVHYDYTKLYSEQEKELDNILSLKSKEVDIPAVDYSTDLKSLTEYYNMHTSPLSPCAYSYLISRGLNHQLIERLRMREGINRRGQSFTIRSKEFIGRDYSGRILVPSLRKDGLISFYVARDYTGTKTPKYLNPPKELAVASEDVWNLDMVESESVIICEGVFTALSASPFKLNSVATYGKSISSHTNSDVFRTTSQGEKLLARGFKSYYIAYDADALREAIDSCKYLYERGANVYLVRIDPMKYGTKADVADIGYNEFLKLLSSAVKYEGGLSDLML